MKVSIRVPEDVLDLDETNTRMYAALGYFTTQCADLENLLDKFIFKYGKLKSPLVRQTIAFPIKMEKKIDFLIAAYIENSALRSCGDADDRLELNSIGYLIEEIWDARKHLIHGRIQSSKHSKNNFSFTSTRYVRESRNNYELTTYRIHRKFIVHLIDGILYIKAFLRNGMDVLDGKSPKMEADEIRRNRAAFREQQQKLHEDDIIVDSNGSLRFSAGEQK